MLDFLNINFYGISLFIILLMIFVCLYLLIRVKLLKKQIETLNTSRIDNEKFLSKEEDIISIRDISNEIKDNISKEETPKEETIKNEIPNKINNNKKENIKHKIELYQPNHKNNMKKQAYTKNILHERPNITSPVSLNNEEFNINDFSPNKQTNNNYLSEISQKISKEIKPHTIELTDYEKEQEDNAIISYKELLNVKDKINNQDDEIETVDFIEELKKFRNSLE